MSVELIFDEALQEADIVVSSSGRVSFSLEHDIKSAALISLFARIGWWADSTIGSNLDVLTSRGKLSATTVRAIEQEASRALRWMIDEDVAESVAVSSERVEPDRLFLNISIKRKGDENGEPDAVTIRWEALDNA